MSNIQEEERKKIALIVNGVSHELEAEEAIRGKTLDVTAADKAAEAAVSHAKQLSMNAYKIEITKTLVKRALLCCRA
jgi:xanthine dehydrogenase YagS FAD-binding subunit